MVAVILVGSLLTSTIRRMIADHVEVVLADVGQRDLDAGEFRHAQDVGDELLGEADAAGADDGDLRVRILLLFWRIMRIMAAGPRGRLCLRKFSELPDRTWPDNRPFQAGTPAPAHRHYADQHRIRDPKSDSTYN